MKANSFENLIADQKFKLRPADEDISNYLLDCGSHFNLLGIDSEKSKILCNGIVGGLEI